MKENLTGPFQAPRSDGIKPGIGIERKNIPMFVSVNMYINIILYSRESFPAKVFPTPSWHVHLRRKRIYEKKYSSILQKVQSILPPFLCFGVKVAH